MLHLDSAQLRLSLLSLSKFSAKSQSTSNLSVTFVRSPSTESRIPTEEVEVQDDSVL